MTEDYYITLQLMADKFIDPEPEFWLNTSDLILCRAALDNTNFIPELQPRADYLQDYLLEEQIRRKNKED